MNMEWRHLDDPSETGVAEWLNAWRERSAHAGVLALVAEHDKAVVPLLQRLATTAELPLVGALFPELVVAGEFRRSGVLLVGLDPMPDYRLLAPLSGAQGWQPAVAALCELAEAQPADSTLLMIFDGLFGHIASLLDDLYYEVGDLCHYAGVNAGSETFAPMPCLFDRERWLGDGVLALGLPQHPGAVLAHGYQVPQEAITASATTGNRITHIGFQPAFTKYAELVREHYGVTIDRENFYSMGVHFPFALPRGDGEILIRIPVAVDEQGALYCVGEVPEGALLTVARAAAPGSGKTVAALVEGYSALHATRGLFFYCAGRRMHLGDAAGEELTQLATALAPQPLIGALTLGEIGNSPAGGYPLFHNAALVALPLEGAS